jgi:hypothetical protein
VEINLFTNAAGSDKIIKILLPLSGDKVKTPKLVLCLSLAIICTWLSVPAWAAGEPAVFLRSGVGARALGMGTAYTALAEDATSVYWNPAKLAWQENFEMTAMYTDLGLDSLYNYVGVILPMPFASLGAGWIQQTTGKIDKTDDFGQSLGQTEAKNDAFMLGYGQPLGEIASFGVAVKMIKQSLDTYSAQALGVDLGLLLDLGSVRLGVNAQNINNPKLSGNSYWDSSKKVSETIPMTFKVGLAHSSSKIIRVGETAKTKTAASKERVQGPADAYNVQGYDMSQDWVPTPPPNQQEKALGNGGENVKSAVFSVPVEVNWALDATYTPDSNQSLGLAPGVEVWVNKRYAVRAGWNFNDFDNAHKFYHNLSLGGSLVWGFLEFDYAYVIHEDLENTHRFSTSFIF